MTYGFFSLMRRFSRESTESRNHPYAPRVQIARRCSLPLRAADMAGSRREQECPLSAGDKNAARARRSLPGTLDESCQLHERPRRELLGARARIEPGGADLRRRRDAMQRVGERFAALA